MYAGIIMAFVLFITTGGFLPYVKRWWAALQVCPVTTPVRRTQAHSTPYAYARLLLVDGRNRWAVAALVR